MDVDGSRAGIQRGVYYLDVARGPAKGDRDESYFGRPGLLMSFCSAPAK